jgi:hypothetical protein
MTPNFYDIGTDNLCSVWSPKNFKKNLLKRLLEKEITSQHW